MAEIFENMGGYYTSSTILTDGASPEQARLGWVTCEDASAVARADALLALPPYHAIDTF